MLLTLIRHGEAAPATDGIDEKRSLTARGHAQAEQTAAFVKQQLIPDVFVVSPLLRAQQTLAHIQAFFPHVPLMLCDNIKPDDDAKQAIEWLSHLHYENIVVVCHMNVIAHIDERLTQQNFSPFNLAEARIYQQNVIAAGLSTQQQVFVPTL